MIYYILYIYTIYHFINITYDPFFLSLSVSQGVEGGVRGESLSNQVLTPETKTRKASPRRAKAGQV